MKGNKKILSSEGMKKGLHLLGEHFASNSSTEDQIHNKENSDSKNRQSENNAKH